jgi:hypothetical protein
MFLNFARDSSSCCNLSRLQLFWLGKDTHALFQIWQCSWVVQTGSANVWDNVRNVCSRNLSWGSVIRTFEVNLSKTYPIQSCDERRDEGY